MCGTVDYLGINKGHLSEAQVRAMLDKLVPTKKIDDHHIERFLSWAGEHFPTPLFEFTLRRLVRDAEIEKENEKGNERIFGYTPIPNSRFGNAFRPLMNGPQYKHFLEQVAARFATQPNQAFWLRGLFWSIGSIDATSLCVIDELVHRGDKDSVRDALQLIGGAPPELALSRPHFAVHIVEEAGRVDTQLGALAESVFISNALSGPFSRPSGQPSPKFLSMKDRSESLRDLFPQDSTGRRVFDRLHAAAVETLNRERLDDEQMEFE
jgi:hypothetical protein